MAIHRIVCVYWVTAHAPFRHTHAVAVGTLAANVPGSEPSRSWSVAQAMDGIAAGDEFVVGLPGALQSVQLTRRQCAVCGAEILHSEPPGRFDGLPECLIG